MWFCCRLTSRMLRMDSIDRQIVAYLVADARSSYSEIGGGVGL
ncbi:MAG TPA: AsnC family protein, partial [Pseudonocardiaceae bacterium]|nr:AsnC family protein [Pseudonocardiaceae bacterium]